MAPNRGKALPPKYNSVALYGADFPFLLFFAFLVFLIYWHLAFFLPGYFPFDAQTKLALTEPRQTFQNVAEGGAPGRETVVGRGHAPGRGKMVKRAWWWWGTETTMKNNGDEHKVTSNY